MNFPKGLMTVKVIVDAFGGDNAPLEILKGASDAVKELGVEIIAVGNEEIIKNTVADNNIDMTGISVVHAPDVFSVNDNPIAIRHKDNNSSMAVGLRLLSEGKGDAFVSAGSTGALVVGGTFIAKRINGIKKPAIGSIIPGDNGPFMLIDSGANIDCSADSLVQFALMGSLYMKNIIGIDNPRVGLANIGVEEVKGTQLCVEAYKLLSSNPKVNFTGNAEVRDIPYTAADVIVTDGFTGNVILKMYEGTASALLGNIKAIFKSNTLTKLSYLGIRKGLGSFKKKMDYKEYGGAALMGLSLPVIKAHGSSDARAIKNAIRQAKDYCEKNVINQIREQLGEKQDDIK